MTRTSTFWVVLVACCVFYWIGPQSSDRCLAQQRSEESTVLPLSAAHVAIPRATTGKTFYATVEWEGQQYHALEGAAVLMKVIMDPATDATIRAKALLRLSRLRSRETTAQLVASYDDLRERQEKLGIMRCLIWSEDPRGFPLFAQVLEHEEDKIVRLSSAVALAHWNVRRGVATLIRVIEECKDDATADRIVCNEAAKEFAWLNGRKGWGFPESRIRQEIVSRTDLGDEEMSALFVLEIIKWFADNEHRFPDWKPGDPLPEVSSEPAEQPSEKPQP